MEMPKSILIHETIINSEVSYQLRSMTYQGKTTYSTGKKIKGSYYPKEFNTLEDANNDYKNITKD